MGDDRTSETRPKSHPSSSSILADVGYLEPHRRVRTNDWIPLMAPPADELAGRVKRASLLLLCVVRLTLLIACANLANLN